MDPKVLDSIRKVAEQQQYDLLIRGITPEYPSTREAYYMARNSLFKETLTWIRGEK